MKWIFTERAIDELIDSEIVLSGLRPESNLVTPDVAVVRTDGLLCLVHRTDGPDNKFCAIALPANENLPVKNSRQERTLMSRLRAFMGATNSKPIRLPASWSAFHFESLIAFHCAARSEELPDTPRWTAESISGTDNYCFWSSKNATAQKLSEFVRPTGEYDELFREWSASLGVATKMFEAASRARYEDSADVDLGDSAFQDVTQHLTYSAWTYRLTVEQKSFIEEPLSHAVKVRGPAGSGKTLALELKAIHDVLDARETGRELSVLFLTHSWLLAEEVDTNLRALSEVGPLDEITVLPLLEVSNLLLPAERISGGLQLIGEDSLAGKRAQLGRIGQCVEELMLGDWLTFRDQISDELRNRFESDDRDERDALVWDCLIEFGCVLGADGIFPGVNSERRYLQLVRSPWMMPLVNDSDKRLILHLYSQYVGDLELEGLLTSDQLVNDFLSYLETYIWNVRRKTHGYDLILVDEYHLFNVQERQVIRYLARSAETYPKIIMALDPRQSPWSVVGGVANVGSVSSSDRVETEIDSISVDLPTVHRFTPEILNLVKHVNMQYPNLMLDDEWSLDMNEVTSSAASGDKPRMTVYGSQSAEIVGVYQLLRSPSRHSGQTAVAIVDETRFTKYLEIQEGLSNAGRSKVSVISSRDDIGSIRYQKRGIVIGPALYLAGLQFDSVIVCGLPDIGSGFANQAFRKRSNLSLIYLAITRASREVSLLVNDEYGGTPGYLESAIEQGHLVVDRGSEV